MSFYLLQAAYNADGWKALLANPQNRLDAIKPALEQLDGSFIAGWLAFGEHDIIAIIDMPSNVSASKMRVSASSLCTPLTSQ